MGETISRPCGRENCGGAFLVTGYDIREFCSERCRNKVKAEREESRGRRRNRQQPERRAAGVEGEAR